MGFLATGRAQTPSAQPPIETSENFQRTCMGGGVKKSENLLINFLAISGDYKPFSFFLLKKNPEKTGMGVPQFLFHPVNSGHLVP
jgi:hypothetical protein